MKFLLDEALFVFLLNQTVWYKQLVPQQSSSRVFVWLTRRSLEHGVTFVLEMICRLHHNFSSGTLCAKMGGGTVCA